MADERLHVRPVAWLVRNWRENAVIGRPEPEKRKGQEFTILKAQANKRERGLAKGNDPHIPSHLD